MRALPAAAAVLFAVSLLAPAAAGYAQPVWYYLKSACPVDEVSGVCPVPEADPPTVPPLPPPVPPAPTVGQPKVVLTDGILDPYDYLRPNPPNSTEPDVKPVYTASESAVPVRFVTPAGHVHPDRLRGYFLVGVYVGESPVPHGNLTTILYELKADGTSLPLANATVAIDLNASAAPAPTSLVPPNSTDPMTILLYEVAQLQPMVLPPPLVFLLGPVDVPFGNDSAFAVGFQLDQGSSPSPQPPGAATLRFNATITPSFVYVPWYAPDPPRPTFSRTSTNPRPGGGPRGTFTGPGGDDGGEGGDGKKGNGIPGFEASLALAMVAVAALVARRRV